MVKRKLMVIVLGGAVLLGGCMSREPTFGERVLAEGESRVEMARLWEAGKEDAREGEKRVREGRRLVESGRAQLRKGEQLVASGNVQVQTSRQAYQGLSQTARSTGDADTASERAGKLRSYAKDWEDGEEMIADGYKLITKGRERIDTGEAEIRRGQQLMETGRRKMQEAEKAYQTSAP